MSAPEPVRGVTLVVPVFGGGAALRDLVERSWSTLASRGVPFEIVLVDDASASPTREIARRIAESTPDVLLLRLATNAGQHAALLAGVRAARHPVVVTLDDDLQNPPEEIPRLLDRLVLGDADVVYGYTPQTAHAWFRRLASLAVRRLLAGVIRSDAVLYVGPFRAFRTDLRRGFDGAVGPGVSLDVLLGWSTDRFAHLEVRHDERVDGESGYSLRTLLRFALDTVTGYSTSLLNLVTVLGLGAVALGVSLLTWVIGRYLVVGDSVAGFPFLASSIAIFSGMQMLSLGIIGQYLGRMHLRIQGRPSYHIAESVSQGADKHGREDVE